MEFLCEISENFGFVRKRELKRELRETRKGRVEGGKYGIV
jgi:hypothetical protein